MSTVNEHERGIKGVRERGEMEGQAGEDEQRFKWGSMMGISQEVLRVDETSTSPPVVPLMKEGGKEAEVGQGEKQKRK